MTTNKFLLAISVAALATAGCKKNYDRVSSNALTPGTVYNMLKSKSKTVTLDVSRGGSFYGNSGTRYSFPANCFVTESGAAVTGIVTITATEYLTKADMLFSKAFPVSNGEPLISGGEFNITVMQGANSLQIKPGTNYTASMPQKRTPAAGLGLFLGTVISDPSQDTLLNALTWEEDTTTIASVEIVDDSVVVTGPRLNWVNADRFLSSPNYQTFFIKISGLNINSETEVFASTFYDNYNGAWPMSNFGADKSEITENHVPDIPVHFVVHLVQDGKFYGGITAATPTTLGVYTVNLVQYDDPKVFQALTDAL